MKRSLPFARQRSGFTLLEIMLVVVIIALLAGSAIFFMGGNLEQAQITRAESDIRSISTQLMMYQATNGFPPSTEQGVKALVNKPDSEPRPRSWRQYMSEVPLDPWKQEYFYEQPGKHNPNSYDLYSAGKDRKPGTQDDIGNWKSS